MKKIGMIVAVEINSVLNKFGTKLIEETAAGFKIYKYKTDNYELIVLSSGAGEIAAASGTQLLISEYKVDLIINFGVVGGLTEEISKKKICIIDKIVHYDYDISEVDNVEVGRYLEYKDIYIDTTTSLVEKSLKLKPELVKVICASGDKFIGREDKKRELHQKFNADICEMEAAGIALTCNRNEIPFIMIKIVSDGITGGAKEFIETKEEAASLCLDIVEEIIKEI